MHRTSLAVVGLTSLLVAGCASPPSPIDLTPRFVAGTSRIEGVQAFAVIKTPIKDIETHLGICWKARVRNVGPGGAVIEATLSRLALKLPGFGFDTDSIIPLGSLGLAPRIAPLLTKLVGLTFTYTVGPQGEVTVQAWDTGLKRAADNAGVPLPNDGQIPGEQTLASAIARAYAAVPHRVVKLKETSARQVDFAVSSEDGARVTGQDSITYKGFAELEFDFGGDDVAIEGLDLPLTGTAQVAGGATTHGIIETQDSNRRGQLVMSVDGRSVLFYREQLQTRLTPSTDIEWLDGIKIADYDTGFVFFAEGGWE